MATMTNTPKTTTSTTRQQSERIVAGASHPWRSSVLAAVLAAVAGLVIRTAAIAVGAVPADYALLQPVRIIVVSVLAALAATILLAVLVRWAGRPILAFRIIAAVFLVVSFAGPLGTGAGAGTIAAMLLMHIAAATIIVGVLPAPGRATR